MDPDDLAGAAALRWTNPGRPDAGRPDPGGLDAERARSFATASAETAVEALYQANAVGLIRMAYLMLGDRPSAEDVVQDAFCGLYRAWERLDPARALPYVRSSVLNGCRSALRRRVIGRRVTPTMYTPPAISAEAAALSREERQEVMQAVRRLPGRQREALVLRFYLDLNEEEIAASMRISRGTVKSTTSRGLAALGRIDRKSVV